MSWFPDEMIAPRLFDLYRVDLRDLESLGPRLRWKANGHSIEEGLDCKAIAYIVMRRANIPVPEEAVFVKSDEEDPLGSFRSYIAEADRLWEFLGREPHLATQLGDLVVTAGEPMLGHEGDENGCHVSALYDSRSMRLATMNRTKRGIVTYPRAFLRMTPCSVYRFRQ